MTSLDTVLAFTYFFFSLYFLEIHFFFIYSFNLSSDSVVYQFNFLLSSFFFIFLVKTLRNLFEKGFLFSMNFHFNEYLVFNSSKVEEIALKSTPEATFFEEDDLLIVSRFVIRVFFFVFFFLNFFCLASSLYYSIRTSFSPLYDSYYFWACYCKLWQCFS